MVIVKLQGGLGNQMFQYAAGKALAVKYQTSLKCDLNFLLDRTLHNVVFRDYDLDIFPNISFPPANDAEIRSLTQKSNIDLINRIIRRTIGIQSYYKELSFAYNKNFEKLPSSVYLNGYWQSEKYFKSIEADIRKDFSFAPFTVRDNNDLKQQILSTDSICLNVRRGDFVNHSGSASTHGFVGLQYYTDGMNLLNSKINNPHYFIFSDDVEWCRDNLKIEKAVTLVDHHHAGKKFADYLQLMTACKHFLIPNSSFAWWAAWLSLNESKIVVAPKKWFADPSYDTSDVLPSSWIRI